MILKNTYTNEEIRSMEAPIESTNDQEMEPAYFNKSYKPVENRNNFSKTVGEQVVDSNTEWNENDPDLPKGWKSKDLNGMTMVKAPPPSSDMYLSRIAAYKALLDNPSGHEEEIAVLKKYFHASGTDIDAALRMVESEWRTDTNLPHGWKYTHTIREAPYRKSGYKRLLSFLTEKGSKLNSSLIALEYLGDAGYSNNDKDRLKAFINATKLNEKRKAEQLKIKSTNSSVYPTLNPPPLQASQERLFENFPAVPEQQEPVAQYPEPQKVSFEQQEPVAQYPEPQIVSLEQPEPIAQYTEPQIVSLEQPEPIAQYTEPPKVVFKQNEPIAGNKERLKVDVTEPTAIKTEPVDPEPESLTRYEANTLKLAKLLAEDMIKIEAEETDANESNEDHYRVHDNVGDGDATRK